MKLLRKYKSAAKSFSIVSYLIFFILSPVAPVLPVLALDTDTETEVLDVLSYPNDVETPAEEVIEEIPVASEIIDEDGTHTFNHLMVSTEYVYSGNDSVKIKFDTLPEGSHSLSIKEVSVDVNGVESVGYDFSTEMENGTFSYTMTLPNPFGDKAQVKFSEDNEIFEEVYSTVSADTVSFTGDHFTVFVVTFNSIPDPMPGAFSSLGYAATATQEFGDHLQLTGSERELNSVEISLTNWSCENDFNWNGSQWIAQRGNNDACVTTPGSSFSHPITLNIYEVDNSGATPAVGALFTSKTINANIPFRPSYDSVNCTNNGETPATAQPFGGKWFDAVLGYCVNGYAFNILYDFSADGIVLPDDVVVSVAFNTGSHGYTPVGINGPYNSLNVSLTQDTPLTGLNVEPDAVFWNTTNSGFYTDGGASGVGILRRDTNWSPYTLVTKLTMVGDTAPSVTIESPLENSYVRGIINGRALATDDNGMGSYYLRFWKDAFESGITNFVGNCQEAPGADLLGTSLDKSCSYDTRTNPDGVYVFSAQFQDSKIQWGQALKTFTVDNTKPGLTYVNPSVANQVVSGMFNVAVEATDNTVLGRIVVHLYDSTNTTLLGSCGSTPASPILGVATYAFNCNIDTTTLADGTYTLRSGATDAAGNNRTVSQKFIVFNDVPVVTINDSVAKVLDGMACGIGSAWSDDGLSVAITNWRAGYKLQGRYFVNGGSFTPWIDMSSWAAINVVGDEASFFANNGGDSTAGHAGWEVRVVDAADTVISNVDSLNYEIVTDPNTFVCNGEPQNLRWENPFVACGGETGVYMTTPTWNAFDNATQYEYNVTTPGIPSWTTVVNSNSYAGAFNQGSGDYSFRVRAIAPYTSEWSDACLVTFNPTQDVPVHVSPSDGGYANTSSLVFDWTDVSSVNGAVSYQFQSSFSPATSGEMNAFTSIVSTSVPMASSQMSSPGNADMTAYWQVRACDFLICSVWSDPWEINIDSTSPDVEITSHNDGDVISGTQEIRGTVTDANLLRYYFVITGTSGVVAGPGTVNTSVTFTDQALLSWDTSSVADGTYTIKLEARDKALNKDSGSSDWVTVVVDNTAPTVPVNGQPDNVAILTNVFDFTWDASTDENPIVYEFQSSLNPSETDGVLDTSVWKNTLSADPLQNPLNSPMIPSKGAPDGKWYWQVRATDSLGNTSDWSEIWDVTIDVEFTLSDLFMNEGDSVPEFSIEDSEAFTLVCDEFSTDDLVVDLPNLTKQTIFECEVTDEAGNTTERTATLTVNNVVPTVSIDVSPSTSVTTGTVVELTANVSDNVLAGNTIVSYQWSGDCSGTTAVVNLNTPTAGSYLCTVEVTDNDGDTASVIQSIGVSDAEEESNNIPSVVILASPGTNVLAGTTVTLQGNILGTDSDFDYTWSGACSGSGTNAGGLTNTTTVPSTPGSYFCRIDVTDANGDTAAAGVVVAVNTNAVGAGEFPESETDLNENTEETEDDEASVLGEITDEDQNNSDENSEGKVLGASETQSDSGTPFNFAPFAIIGLIIAGLLFLLLFFRRRRQEEIN